MKGWALILIIVVLISSGCATQKNISEGKNQQVQPGVSNQTQTITAGNMQKVLFIIAQTNFRDEELEKPKQILENAGYNVDVASITTQQATGMLGARVKPDLAVKDVKISNYALIVVVGGSGAPELAKYPEVLNLLSQAKNNNMKLGGICLGPSVMAKAGVLEGKQATVFKTSDSLAALEQGGATFIDQKIVVEPNLVTANGPAAATEFGNELVKLLQS
jgi:protease I